MDTTIEDILEERVLILDGAMGTMIQQHKLTEKDYRGENYANWPSDLKGNNDLLVLTKPKIISDIHHAFLAAGADIIETNSFNSTSISMADYDMESEVEPLNLAAAKLARDAADAWSAKTPDKPRFVAGSVGPMNKTLSISPDVNNPGFREVTFDQVKEAYTQQMIALIEGGVDLILLETIFDTLNAKAALIALEEAFDQVGKRVPLMISCTITDRSGRNLSGQTIEAFWYSIRHAKPLTVGLNCALGADLLRPYMSELSAVAECYVSAHPNAGLPNEMGEYDESAEVMSSELKSWAEDGLLNVVGGCCGTTPEHIKAIAEAVSTQKPRVLVADNHAMRLAGLEPLKLAAGMSS